VLPKCDEMVEEALLVLHDEIYGLHLAMIVCYLNNYFFQDNHHLFHETNKQKDKYNYYLGNNTINIKTVAQV